MSIVVKIRKHFILDQDKIKRVRKIVNAKTDTEAITMALDSIIDNSKIETVLGSIKGNGTIKDVYGKRREYDRNILISKFTSFSHR